MDDIHHEEFSKGPRFGVRHVQLTLLVGLCALEANVRVMLPYTLEAMTKSNVTSDSNNTHPFSNHTILSSFDWGYIILPIVGGKLSTVYDTKRILTITVLVNSVVFMLMPFSAGYFKTAGILILRVFQGLCAGLYSTVCYHILAHWTPPQEMSRTIAMLNSGYSLGYLITIAPTAKICSWAGWPATYYLSGCLGFLWIIPWTVYASNSPTEHKTITTREKMYIQASLSSREYPKQIPWKAILTSLPMSAIIFSVIAKGCMDSLVLNEIRFHMRTIMGFSVEKTDLALTLPYLLRTIVIILGGCISDWLVNKHFLSKTVARKIFNSVGTIIPAIALPFLTLYSVDKTTYISNLLIVIVASAATYDGCMVNIMDISPTFCGTLRGITSFVYTLFSLLLPLAVISIIDNIENSNEWRILFTQVTCINIFAGMFYIFFASGKIQRWLPTTKIRVYGSILWRADEKTVNESNL